MLVYLDGKLVPKEEAKVAVFDHGVLYGDGVFEGIRVYDGNIFRLREHIVRLFESAKTIWMDGEFVDWEDAMSHPQLTFHVTPREVVRRYVRGQSIELGLIESDTYRVVYQDGVEAEFRRTGEAAFSFEFSTGFRGSFWKDPDGSYTISFRGDRLDDQDEDQKSQSKFIISRCKYSGNLLLILQDDATVYLG